MKSILTGSARFGLLAIIAFVAGACGSGGLSPIPGPDPFLGGSAGSDAVTPTDFPGVPVTVPGQVLPFTSEVRAALLHPDGTRLYLLDRMHESVSVVDLASGRVSTVLRTGAAPGTMALAPKERQRLFVTNAGAGTVTVIDTASDTPVDTEVALPGGVEPYGIAFNASGERAYVVDRSTGIVHVLDGATGAPIETVSLGTLSGVTPVGPTVAVLDATGTHLFVADTGRFGSTNVPTQFPTVLGGHVFVVSWSAASASVAAIAVAPGPVSVLATRSQPEKIYVSCSGSPGFQSNSIHVFDGPSGAPLGSIAVEPGPVGMLYDDASRRLFVAHLIGSSASSDCIGLTGSVSVLDTTLDVVVTPAPLGVGTGPIQLALNAERTRLYVLSSCSPSIDVIDVQALTLGAPVALSKPGTALAIGADEIYAVGTDGVERVRLDTQVAARSSARGFGPLGMAVADLGGGLRRLLVTDLANDRLVVLDAADGSVLTLLAVGPRPADVAFDSVTKRAFVASAGVYGAGGERLTAVDVTQGVLLGDVQLPSGARGPHRLDIIDDGLAAFVLCFGHYQETSVSSEDAGTARFDPAAAFPITALPTSEQSGGTWVAPSPDGLRAYIAHYYGVDRFGNNPGGVYVADSTDPTVSGSPHLEFPTGDGATAVAVDAAETRVWSFNDLDDSITVHDRTNGLLLSTRDLALVSEAGVPMHLGLVGAARTGDATDPRVFGLSQRGNQVLALSLGADIQLEARDVNAPVDLAVAADHLFVVSYYGDAVRPIRLTDAGSTVFESLDAIPVGRRPVRAVVDQAGGCLYVANSLDRSISVIDLASRTVKATWSIDAASP